MFRAKSTNPLTAFDAHGHDVRGLRLGNRWIERSGDAGVDRTQCTLLGHHDGFGREGNERASGMGLGWDDDLEVVAEGPEKVGDAPRSQGVAAPCVEIQRDAWSGSDHVQVIHKQVNDLWAIRFQPSPVASDVENHLRFPPLLE